MRTSPARLAVMLFFLVMTMPTGDAQELGQLRLVV